MSTTREQHERRNQLTEHEKNYKRYNTEIIDAYNAVNPPTLSKLSMVIFNAIMDNKLHRQPTARDYSRTEDKRIYNSKYITLEDLLDRCQPYKYGVESKPVKNDLSNLMARLKELDDYNIFYIWRYGKPFTYMFVMERDIGVWKYFNNGACVHPKTLNKIVSCFSGMVNCIVKFEKTRGRPVELKNIEISFVKDFIPHIMSKMDKNVVAKLPKWDQNQSITDYLMSLKETIKPLYDYEGLEEDPSFLKHLPRHLVAKIESKAKNKKENKMNIAQLSRDLIPEDESLIKDKKYRAKRSKPNPKDSLHPEKTTFQMVDPFLNCNQLLKYYREVIRLYNKNAKFYPPDSERVPATQIMDLLIENGKNGDKDFLRSWIRYYIGSYLQGNNVYKPEKTSLSSFKKTFRTYEGKYFRA
jgi:hypothetical protein